MKLTQEQKILAVVGILPAIADLMEDIKLFRTSKRYANMFIEEVRRIDDVVIKDAEFEVLSQQANIQRAFYQWLQTEFIAE